MASMDNVGWDCRGFFGEKLLKVGLTDCVVEFEFTLKACGLQKALGYGPCTSLCSCPKAGYHGHLRAMP